MLLTNRINRVIKRAINYVRYGRDLVVTISPDSKLINLGTFRRSYPSTNITLTNQSELIMESHSMINVDCEIRVGHRYHPHAKLEFGRFSYINSSGLIICWNSIMIGVCVAIGHNVTIRDNDGTLYGTASPVIIENDVWICDHAIILKGTKIGAGSVVGAGAVLAGGKEWPSNSLIIGNPARVVRTNIPPHAHTMHTL